MRPTLSGRFSSCCFFFFFAAMSKVLAYMVAVFVAIEAVPPGVLDFEPSSTLGNSVAVSFLQHVSFTLHEL